MILLYKLCFRDNFTLKNGCECAAILADPYFWKIFQNFERRYLGIRLSHNNQQDIIRKVWSCSTNYVFTTLFLKDCFTLKNGRECAAIKGLHRGKSSELQTLINPVSVMRFGWNLEGWSKTVWGTTCANFIHFAWRKSDLLTFLQRTIFRDGLNLSRGHCIKICQPVI